MLIRESTTRCCKSCKCFQLTWNEVPLEKWEPVFWSQRTWMFSLKPSYPSFQKKTPLRRAGIRASPRPPPIVRRSHRASRRAARAEAGPRRACGPWAPRPTAAAACGRWAARGAARPSCPQLHQDPHRGPVPRVLLISSLSLNGDRLLKNLSELFSLIIIAGIFNKLSSSNSNWKLFDIVSCGIINIERQVITD